MKWDGTITLGNLLTVLSILITLLIGYTKVYTRVIRFMDKIEFLLTEFPPHRHNGESIIYAETSRRRTNP